MVPLVMELTFNAEYIQKVFSGSFCEFAPSDCSSRVCGMMMMMMMIMGNLSKKQNTAEKKGC